MPGSTPLGRGTVPRICPRIPDTWAATKVKDRLTYMPARHSTGPPGVPSFVETPLPASRRSSACAGHSISQGEPLAGTAGAATAWLLVEHPGPWQRKAVKEALGPDIAGEIERRAPSVKIVLIRRTEERTVERPWCYLVWTGGSSGTRPWIRETTIDRYDDLLELDLEALAAGGPVGTGSERHDPLYAVCTNGKRDACCAEFGRPVATALAAEHGGVWECTHVGGHRFAGNMVCFPHGLFYGRLTPESALAATDRYRAGHVRLDNLRGRSGQPAAAQVAEHFVRRREQVTALDTVRAGAPTATGAPDDSKVDVPVTVAGHEHDDEADRRFTVRLRRAPVGDPVPSGCDDATEQRYTWVLDGRPTAASVSSRG